MRYLLAASMLLTLGSCGKRINWNEVGIPGNTLILEFTAPVRYVMDIQVDSKDIPIQYSGKNRVLKVEGLSPGEHHFSIHSISYVFGPEFSRFEVSEEQGAHFHIQSRKYRLALPKKRAQVSIRAFRKELKKNNIKPDQQEITARFD